jgi:hypothetical protein
MGRDAQRIHELVEELLDREDSLIVLIDGERAITYGSGFGLSACQQELASTEIERTVRALGATTTAYKEKRKANAEIGDSGGGTRVRGPLRRDGVRAYGGLAHRRTPRVEPGDTAIHSRGHTAGPVLREARTVAASGLE